MSAKKPLALVILDGYGYREDTASNAIANAKTPVMDALIANNPHTLISASGMSSTHHGSYVSRWRTLSRRSHLRSG